MRECVGHVEVSSERSVAEYGCRRQSGLCRSANIREVGAPSRAYQEGPVVFRFVLRPHEDFDPASASRFAIGQSQPLPPAGVRGDQPCPAPPLIVDSPNMIHNL